MTFILINMKH